MLGEVGEQVVAVHGQSDQLRLLRPAEQRAALDRFAGPEHEKLLDATRDAFTRWRRVVDDLADSRTIMRHMLESLGFRVETLGSGPEALDRLKDNMLRATPIELIMMDWKMPEMDGFEVSRKIRQEMKLALPIIMMTAFGKEEQRIAAEMEREGLIDSKGAVMLVEPGHLDQLLHDQIDPEAAVTGDSSGSSPEPE